MTMQKIAVTLPPPTLARARAAVRKGRAPSVSAYVTKALDELTMADELEELLVQMLAESGGPLTAAERRAARAALGVKPARKRR